MEVTISISRNTELWGAEDEDQQVVTAAAQLLADTIAQEIREAYPEAEITATTVDTVDGASHRIVQCTGEPDDETWEDVTGYASRTEDLWEACLMAASKIAKGRVWCITPGHEAGMCPHCGMTVVARFDEAGSIIHSTCPSCTGELWSPADVIGLVWFRSEAEMKAANK
jgi:hypothetical protein